MGVPYNLSLCKWRKAENPSLMPVEAPSVFEAVAAPWPLHLPKWRMAMVSNHTHLATCPPLSRRGRGPPRVTIRKVWRVVQDSDLRTTLLPSAV